MAAAVLAGFGENILGEGCPSAVGPFDYGERPVAVTGHDWRWMVKYLLMLHAPDGPPQDEAGEAYAETFAAYAAATAAMASAGVLIDCAPLQPTASSTTVRVRDGQTIVTDGPAAEIKEQVGGYTLLECADLDEALKWAATIPAASTGWVEIRPVMPTPMPS
ncbi:YciI family protein [Streptomyces sp. NBC_00079]|uniref:YciI family protein n=1 Tax=Streptomyces sp. NBC_00079 TaxID=2975644 RepID=UPI0032440B3E